MEKNVFSRIKIIIPLYRYSVYIFISASIVVISTFISQYLQNELYEFFTPSIFILGILSLITPWIARYLYKTFLSLQEVIDTLTETSHKEWFERQKYLFFGLNFWSISVALFVMFGGLATNYYLAWGLWSSIARIAFFIQIGLLFCILGFLGWAYIGILFFAYRLRSLAFDLDPFETKKEEFDKLNSSFLRMFSSGVILYAGAAIAVWLVAGPYILYIPLLQLWVLLIAAIILAFFILIQIFLHATMKKAKNIRVNKISLLTRRYYQEWEKKPSADQSAQINNLLTWKEKIEKESDWPFEIWTVVSIIVTIILPAIKSIMDLF
jgi:hypothetical protein